MARIDLHCHTSASFDGRADPEAVVRRAAERGLTHLAITDHDTIDGALRAAEAAERAETAARAARLRVIVGSEVLTEEGDLIFLFLRSALPRGLSARAAIDAGRAQGALVGLPHPFDRERRSVLRDREMLRELLPLVRLVDWVEVRNGRVLSQETDELAARLARDLGLPGVGVSDAHTLLEVGAVATRLAGDPSTPSGLLEALRAGARVDEAAPGAAPARRTGLAALLHGLAAPRAGR